MVQRVSGKKRFLVRFQYGCEKDLNSNKLTAVAVEKNPVDEEPKVPTIASVPENAVDLEKGWYHGVYGIQDFTKEGGVYIKEIRWKWTYIQMRRIL